MATHTCRSVISIRSGNYETMTPLCRSSASGSSCQSGCSSGDLWNFYGIQWFILLLLLPEWIEGLLHKKLPAPPARAGQRAGVERGLTTQSGMFR